LRELLSPRSVEFGFAKHAALPMPDLLARLRALDFGDQNDDQTILLARHVA
jgi:hypothetical protein